jgi:hypothetical protein
MKKILFMVCLFNMFAVAQCPVQVTKVFTLPHRQTRGEPWINSLYIEFRNTTSEEIAGVKFNADVENAVGDKRSVDMNFVDRYGLKGGKKKTRYWDADALFNYKDNKWSVWVTKISFKNGQTWEDDGSHACQISS